MKLELTGGEFHSTTTSFDSKILNLEEQETNFLFRHVKSYATGHGISVTWEENELGIVNKVYTQSIPMFYRETISTGIPGIKLNMMSLHNDSELLVQNNLRSLLSGYRRWIKENEAKIGHSLGLFKYIALGKSIASQIK